LTNALSLAGRQINRVRTLAIDEELTQSPLLIFKGKKQQHWR